MKVVISIEDYMASIKALMQNKALHVHIVVFYKEKMSFGGRDIVWYEHEWLHDQAKIKCNNINLHISVKIGIALQKKIH